MAKFSISVLFSAIDKVTKPVRGIARVMANLGKLARKLGRAFVRMARSIAKSLSKVGKKMTDIGKSMAMKLTLPITAFGTLAIRSARNFEEAMNMVRAVTKASESDFKMLNDQAKELGATTKFSATQAADAMKFLGMSGLKTKEIFDAMPYVLELAASAQLDMGTAANISTNIMKGYGKEAKDLANINDILVNAFTNANVDLQMLGESFKYAGPIAKGAGLSIETTTAMIAKMGDAGIQGSMAGTAMRGMLLRLANPTKKASKLMRQLGIDLSKGSDEEKGSAKGVLDLVDAIKQMEDAGATAIDIAKMVGDRAGPGLAVLVDQGTVSLEAFIEMIKEQGTAARVAKMQMRGLPGVFYNLASAWEAFQLATVESGFGDFVSKVIIKLTGFLRYLAKANPKLLNWGVTIAIVVAAIAPLIIIFGTLAIAINQIVIVIPILIKGFVAVKGVFIGLTAALGIGLAPLLAIIAAFTSLAYLGKVIYNNWAGLEDIFWHPIETLKDFIKYITQLKNILPRSLLMKLGWEDKKEEYEGVKSISEVSKVGKVDNWELKKARERIRSYKGLIQKDAAIGKTESQTDINLKVTSDAGTNVAVEKIVKKKGDAKVKLATDGYVGQTLGAMP